MAVNILYIFKILFLKIIYFGDGRVVREGGDIRMPLVDSC